MRLVCRSQHRLILGAIAALLSVAVLGLLLIWSGLYNVAASRGHFAAVEWLLAFTMRNSVVTHAKGIVAPALDDDALIRLGAAHFDRGCAECHGAPGRAMSAIARQMVPPPPALSAVATNWSDVELFWIIKHGIKYTGMPSWIALEREDEVWAVVAVVRRLPHLDAEQYGALARGDAVRRSRRGGLGRAPSTGDAVIDCASCHGAGDDLPASSLVPILQGQPVEMLNSALAAYAAGQRSSGIMQAVATDLSPATMQRIAETYARTARPRTPPPTSVAGNIEEGRRLAIDGLPGKLIPSCMACHGAQAHPSYPRLAGQHGRYMAERLRRWQQGSAGRTPGEAIMAPLARRLSQRQIVDVSAYFESLDSATPVDGQGSPR